MLGLLAANRELIEWIRGYNADPHPAVKLHYYGFDPYRVYLAGHGSPAW